MRIPSLTLSVLAPSALVIALGGTFVAAGGFFSATIPTAEASTAAPAQYRIDPVHTSVIFRINHLGVADFFGRFNRISGGFTFDDADPANNRIAVAIEADSVDTNNRNRDEHLRGPDFFNATQFPRINFSSSSVEPAGEGLYNVKGELEIMGKKVPVETVARHIGAGESRGRQLRGFTATFTVKRSEFGMTYMLDGLGDEVEVTIAVEGQRQ